MKKILLAVVICLGLVACGEKSKVEGSYVSNGRAFEKLTFATNGSSVSYATNDGFGGAELQYKIDGNKVTITGLVPSEYFINKDGNLTNNITSQVYIKK